MSLAEKFHHKGQMPWRRPQIAHVIVCAFAAGRPHLGRRGNALAGLPAMASSLFRWSHEGGADAQQALPVKQGCSGVSIKPGAING
jgi:hypothetical protein